MGKLGAIWGDVAPPGIGHAERLRDVQRKRASRAAQRDVQIPPVADPARRDACAQDLERFDCTYFPTAFRSPFSREQRLVIQDQQDTILAGGNVLDVAPRGDGKSTRARPAILWALLFGHIKFAFNLCDVHKSILRAQRWFRHTLETNDLLFDDFPWLCACARALEGSYNRGGTQTTVVDGDRIRTRINLSGGQEEIFLFPVIPGELGSGAALAFGSMDGSLRGPSHTLDDGTVIRPQLVYCDDPQKRADAANPDLVAQNLRILLGDVIGQAGPDETMSVIYNGTIIAHGDMTSQLADRELHPDFRGRIRKMMPAMPTNTELWKKYEELRHKELKASGHFTQATEFYAAHRCKRACLKKLDQPRDCASCARAPQCMDAGAVAGWLHRFNKRSELSPVQCAQNIIYKDGLEVFLTEYQNEPPRQSQEELLILDSYRVENATGGLKRTVVPNDAIALCVGADVNKYGVTWALGAFAPGRRRSIVDYGVQEIDAPRGEIKPGDTRKLQELSQAILGGLRRLRDKFQTTPPLRQSGEPMPVTLALADSKWMKDAVIRFCLEEESRGCWFPAMGCGTMPGQPHWRPPKEVEISRDGNMYVRMEQVQFLERGQVPQTVTSRRFFCHADHYKKSIHDGFFISPEDPGSLRLFSPEHFKDHHTYARHLTAEMQIQKYPGVFVWVPRRGYADNHYLDATYLLDACASILEHKLPAIGVGGMNLPPTSAPALSKRSASNGRANRSNITEVEI